MHPILADKKKLAVYLSVWFFVGLLLSLLFVPRIDWATALMISMPMALVYAFMSLASWYPNRTLPLESTGFARIFVVNLLGAVISSIVWVLFGRALVVVLFQAFALEGIIEQYTSHYPILYGTGILLFLLASAVHYLLIAFEASREVERRALELKLLAQEAELKALRAQIDPHFLFNSLNSISALTTQDPSAARRMCVLLADFLRMSLKVGTQERISLGEEMNLIKHFLEIERVRFGNRLQVKTAIEDDSAASPVPPLLLQPLVENAIKHGIARRVEGGTIELHGERNGSRLNIRIDNPIDPDQQKGLGNGIGLQNVKNRLFNLYGNDARIDTEVSHGRFVVELSLPVENT